MKFNYNSFHKLESMSSKLSSKNHLIGIYFSMYGSKFLCQGIKKEIHFFYHSSTNFSVLRTKEEDNPKIKEYD